MKRTLVLWVAMMGLLGWTASAADFNLVAYTGHYNSAYPTGTIEDLEEIPIGEQGWPMIYQYNPPPGEPQYCDPENIEIFLFISTDLTDCGIGGIDLYDTTAGSDPPSGIYSGDWDMHDPYVGIHNRAYWDPPPPQPGKWAPVHDEFYANSWDGYSGYVAADDTWYFHDFANFDLGPLTEDPATPPGNAYCGDFYRGTGLQFTLTGGWLDPLMGSSGELVPYMHLVFNKNAIPCGEKTWISIAGLPALTCGIRPTDYNWLGQYIVDPGSPPYVPYGRIEILCVIPEPATLGLLALAGLPALLRRRR